MGDVKAI
jgi:hypothetical protein